MASIACMGWVKKELPDNWGALKLTEVRCAEMVDLPRSHTPGNFVAPVDVLIAKCAVGGWGFTIEDWGVLDGVKMCKKKDLPKRSRR